MYLSSSELDFNISQVGKAQAYVCNGVSSLIRLRLQSFVLIIMHLTFSELSSVIILNNSVLKLLWTKVITNNDLVDLQCKSKGNKRCVPVIFFYLLTGILLLFTTLHFFNHESDVIFLLSFRHSTRFHL